MPTFPRTIVPRESTGFSFPAPLMSVGHSGKLQVRATNQAGRTWSEAFPPIHANHEDARELLITIRNGHRNGTVFDVDHRHYQTKNGSGTGSPLVAGASQTGSSLNTDTWTGSDPVLKAGDLIRLAGLNQIYELTADAPNLAAGATTLAIYPPIVVGGSPANDAAITYAAPVMLKAVIVGVDPGGSGPDMMVFGLSIQWRETP